VSCDLVKKFKEREEVYLQSGWCDKELEAEQKVYWQAAKNCNLLDRQVGYTVMYLERPRTYL
jgi:hypothetical protein